MHPTEHALNDYVDDALPPDERTRVAEHLEACAECRQTVDDLGRIKQASAALPPLVPPAGPWERIRGDVARSLQANDRRSAKAFARQPWLAAAAALVLASGAAWYFAARGGRPSPTAANGSTLADAQAVAAELQQAEEHYQKAIAGLETIANSEKGALDPQTAATIEKNLTVVDQAIGESRAALRQQPTSEPAQQSLLENFRTKLALLEDTVALINEMRKGNETGAARIASGLKQHKG